MAKFVLAGRADCPFYAKAEVLADYLQKNLPDFQIYKITQHPHVWEEWLKDLCEKNKWNHKNSPIIWRELLDRGGKGLLLGGYNEFLEHAQLYYGVTSSMTTEMMKVIAGENLEAHMKKELETEPQKDLTEPLQVWITSASASACCHLIPILTSGEVFGMHTQISITLFDKKQTEETLQTLATETRHLVSPFLQSVAVCTRVEEAFRGAHVVLILDDPVDKEVLTTEEYTRSRVPLCRLLGHLIEKNAHESVRVIVGGKTFVNLKTALLIRYAPKVARNIIAVALGVEGQARAALARKLKTSPSCNDLSQKIYDLLMKMSRKAVTQNGQGGIKDVIVWGNISGCGYVDLRKAKVYRYDSAVWGPPHFARPVLSLIFDSEWVNKEFVATLNEWIATGKQFRGILAAHSIATTLKYWYHGSPPGEIVSLGVLSEGQFGVAEGVVFSMPAKCENGTWEVLTDLEDIELDKQILTRITRDLIQVVSEQEILVAFGDVRYFQPHQSEIEKTTSADKKGNQESQQVSGEHTASSHSDLNQEEEKAFVMLHVDFSDLIPKINSEKPFTQVPINDYEGRTVKQ